MPSTTPLLGLLLQVASGPRSTKEAGDWDPSFSQDILAMIDAMEANTLSKPLRVAIFCMYKNAYQRTKHQGPDNSKIHAY